MGDMKPGTKKRPASTPGKDGDKKPRTGGKDAGKKDFKDGKKPFKKPFGQNKKPEQPIFANKKEQKEYIREKKAKSRPNFALNEDISRDWEKIRKEEPKKLTELVKPIFAKVKGHVCDLASNHKGSRVLQAVLKYGDKALRDALLTELQAKVVELAKNNYGHFLVRKMYELAPKEKVPHLVGLLRGHIRPLLRHPCGSSVVEEAYTVAPKSMRTVMMSEFYSNEYKLAIKQDTVAPTFEEVLAKTTDRMAVMRHVYTAVTPILEKGMVDHEIVQGILAQYVRHSGAQSMAELVEALAGPPLMRMVHTRDGMEVSVAVVQWGAAKHRKKIVKATKTHVGKMARDKYGHVVLMALMSCMDDTTLLGSTVLKELRDEIDGGGVADGAGGNLVDDPYGSRVLLHLLRPGVARYFPAPVLEMLQPRKVAAKGKEGGAGGAEAAGEAGEGEGEDEDEDDETELSGAVLALGTSKKEPEVRRKELLCGNHGLVAGLYKVCARDTAYLIRSKTGGADVLFEAATGGLAGLAAEAAGEGAVAAVREAVGDLVREEPGEGAEATGEAADAAHVMEQFFARRTLIRMLTAEPEGDQAVPCAAALWAAGFKGQCDLWVKSQYGAKVLAALAGCPHATTAAAAAKELAPLVKPKSVAAWAAEQKGGGDKPAGKKGGSAKRPAPAPVAAPAKVGKASAKGGKKSKKGQ